MNYHYSPDECINKIEHTLAQFAASQALIEQIKINWIKVKDAEEPKEKKGWFKNLIQDIKNKVESVDETKAFFDQHVDKYFAKFQDVKDVHDVVMANLLIQKGETPLEEIKIE